MISTLYVFSFIPPSDRIRTAVNVFGDCVGSAIVHHMNNEDLIKFERREQQEEIRIEEEPVVTTRGHQLKPVQPGSAAKLNVIESGIEQEPETTTGDQPNAEIP